MPARSLDPADSPEAAEKIVTLSVKYLRDVAVARLGTLALTVETVQISMGHEIGMLEFLTLWTPEAIATRVTEYHESVRDFPRPMGVLP